MLNRSVYASDRKALSLGTVPSWAHHRELLHRNGFVASHRLPQAADPARMPGYPHHLCCGSQCIMQAPMAAAGAAPAPVTNPVRWRSAGERQRIGTASSPVGSTATALAPTSYKPVGRWLLALRAAASAYRRRYAQQQESTRGCAYAAEDRDAAQTNRETPRNAPRQHGRRVATPTATPKVSALRPTSASRS